MKVAIVGSRSFLDYDFLKLSILSKIEVSSIDLIISGGAKGVDSLAEKFAKEFNIPTKIILPDWKTKGKAAGISRNKEIVNECDIGFVFWDGESKGTKFIKKYFDKQNKKYHLFMI